MDSTNGHSEKNRKMENENIMDRGYIFAPYIAIVTKRMINGEVCWYKNKWKNLLLKIKHYFIKPKYLKYKDVYNNRKINSNYYHEIAITPKENR